MTVLEVVPTAALLSEELATVDPDLTDALGAYAPVAATLRWASARMTTEQLADLLEAGEQDVEALTDLASLLTHMVTELEAGEA